MSTEDLLTRLVCDWQAAIETPYIAKRVLFSRRYFADAFVQRFVERLLLSGGNVRQALADVSACDTARAKRLREWVAGVTARPVRGLLTWPYQWTPPLLTTGPVRPPSVQYLVGQSDKVLAKGEAP